MTVGDLGTRLTQHRLHSKVIFPLVIIITRSLVTRTWAAYAETTRKGYVYTNVGRVALIF